MTASHAAYCSTGTPGKNNNIRVHDYTDDDVYELARHHWNIFNFFLDFFSLVLDCGIQQRQQQRPQSNGAHFIQ